MNLNIDNLLTQEKYYTALKDYTYVNIDEYHTIPTYSFIMYIDRDGSIKPGGFFIRYYDAKRPDEKRILLKFNKAFNNILPIFYHIFYKDSDNFNKDNRKPKKHKINLLFKKIIKNNKKN